MLLLGVAAVTLALDRWLLIMIDFNAFNFRLVVREIADVELLKACYPEVTNHCSFAITWGILLSFYPSTY